MKKYQVIHSLIERIQKFHSKYFGWEVGDKSWHQTNYMLYKTFPDFDIENWLEKEKSLKKVIVFYLWLKKNIKLLDTVGIYIEPAIPKNDILFFPDKKAGKIFFSIKEFEEKPVLVQIDNLIKTASGELKETQEHIKTISQEVDKETLEILDPLLKHKQTTSKKGVLR